MENPWRAEDAERFLEDCTDTRKYKLELVALVVSIRLIKSPPSMLDAEETDVPPRLHSH